MSRWVDLPVRVVGDTSADVDPVVVAMGLKERDRNRAFELRETMSPEAWREMMLEISALIKAFCDRWEVEELALFGSVLRDDFGPDSDVDVLVRFRTERTPGLFGIAGMERELAELLDRRVDLVTRTAIEESRNYIRRKAILESARVVYARVALGRGRTRSVPALTPLSEAARTARKPLPPPELYDAKSDRVHKELGRGRAARTARGQRRGRG